MFNAGSPLAAVTLGDYFRGTTTGVVSAFPALGMQILVDWDNDGDFSSALENITADVVGVISCRRGRDYASQLIGKSVAGELRLTVRNQDGKYSIYNASSPIAGNTLPGRLIMVRLTTPVSKTLWTGYIKDVRPLPGLPLIAEIFAEGPITRLVGPLSPQISTPFESAITIQQGINRVLDAAGWSPSLRKIDSAGAIGLIDFWVSDVYALDALRNIEAYELGFLYETAEGEIGYDLAIRRSARGGATRFTDEVFPGIASWTHFLGIEQSNPDREIINTAKVTVLTYSTGALAVLWSTAETFVLTPGTSLNLTALYPNVGSPSGAAAVAAWTTPVHATDYTESGGSGSDAVTVLLEKTATSMRFRITNTSGVNTVTIAAIQARGTPVAAQSSTTVISVDDADTPASRKRYGNRDYDVPTDLHRQINLAQGQANAIVHSDNFNHESPRPILRVSVVAYDLDVLASILTLDVSGQNNENLLQIKADNVLTALGINNNFFIESVAFEIPLPGLIEFTFELSPQMGTIFPAETLL